MSDGDSRDIHELIGRGISEEEAHWLSSRRVTPSGCDAPESAGGHFGALWIALGAIAYSIYSRLMGVSFYGILLAVGMDPRVYERPVVPVITVAISIGLLACFLVFVSRGGLNGVTERARRRYSNRRVLLRDLAGITIALPLLLQALTATLALFLAAGNALSSNVNTHEMSTALFFTLVSLIPTVCFAAIILKVTANMRGYVAGGGAAAEADLESEVAGWRKRMRQSEAMDAGDIAELEEHLREETAALERTGLSCAQSFALACRRIGEQGELDREYSKVNFQQMWRARAYWIALGFFLRLVLRALLESFSMPLLWGRFFSSSQKTPVFILMLFESLILWSVVYVIYMRYVSGRTTWGLEWLKRRHAARAGLVWDLALFVFLIFGIQAAFTSVAYPTQTASFIALFQLIRNDTPQLLMVSAALVLLHPSAGMRKTGV